LTISYEEAAEIVRAHFEPGWTRGTFCLDDRNIVENDEFYVFDVGAREDLVDGDVAYAVAGGVPVVFKSDGHIESRASVTIATDPTVRERENPSPTLTL
jgi:5-formaminoimidazole-4-carboxamide-1-beta-D-ribofuranosyl 5'-monophosphate synthetase